MVAVRLEAVDDLHNHVAVPLGATAGLRAQTMIDLEWGGDSTPGGNGTRVTLPHCQSGGQWADAGELMVSNPPSALVARCGARFLDNHVDVLRNCSGDDRWGPVLKAQQLPVAWRGSLALALWAKGV